MFICRYLLFVGVIGFVVFVVLLFVGCCVLVGCVFVVLLVGLFKVVLFEIMFSDVEWYCWFMFV